MDADTREYFKIRPLMLQNLLWELELCGDFVGVKAHAIESRAFVQAKRNPVTKFTRSSRLRLLKFIAKVDWSKCGDGLFLTLTYPDECVPKSVAERNQHRFLFHRYMENHLQDKIPMLWRLEWVPRKSGQHRGKFVPHIHLIAFKGGFIHHEVVRECWRKVVKKEGALCTDVDALGDAMKIRMYIAKYAAKVPSLPSLDYVSYLNKGGRHYGYQRKNLVPMHRKISFVDLTPGLLATLRNLACESLPNYDSKFDAGFVLLGKNATAAREEILQLALAEGMLPVYS